jgi:nucleotidyltransferase substrate binding protein (TIGR01987 family)
MNTDEKIILTPLEKAILTLEEALNLPKDVIVRDATIQRFEYTFELSVKFLKRYLETLPEGHDVDLLNYRDLIRLGAEAGIIEDTEAWFLYREARNITSHAYNENKAEDVYNAAKKFNVDAKKLLSNLQSRI